MYKQANIIVLWNARELEGDDIRLPAFLNAFLEQDMLLSNIVIVLTPLKNGLIKINIVKISRAGIEYGKFYLFIYVVVKDAFAPLINNTITNSNMLPLLLKYTIKILNKYAEGSTCLCKEIEHYISMQNERLRYVLIYFKYLAC